MRLTRRFALASSACLAVGLPARAAVPLSAAQAASFYRTKIGDIEITATSDGTGTRKLEGFVRNAPDAEVKAALAEAFLRTDVFSTNYNPILINTSGKLLLIDTGNGDLGASDNGLLLASLAAAGVRPQDIDAVVFSHFHPDHINGARHQDGAFLFPNAEIMVPEVEWAFWMNDDYAAQAPAGLQATFRNVRRVFGPIARDVTRYAWNREVAPGVLALGAPGHTPGHTVFAITSGDQRFMMMSDITNNTSVFVRHPDWSMILDQDGEQARLTRHRMLDLAASERMQCAFYHAPFPATGFIARDGAGYQFVPATWAPRL